MPKNDLSRAFVVSRRRALSLAAATVALAPARALADESKTYRGGAWIFGDKFSLAALLYARGASPAMVDKMLAGVKRIGGVLKVDVPPFPPKSAKSMSTMADTIHFLLAGDGAKIGVDLSKRYGEAAGALYEVSVKSNLLIPLYAPGDALGGAIAKVIRARMAVTDAPEKLWRPLADLVDSRRPAKEVGDAVFKMHADVANFYVPGSY
ncbi:MAG: hypothetical protein KGI57_11860 [Hyphomicrobiales bacterium]|nr:hypothetical protein [Hyphomicrobiales bacterium]MDE2018383.1 hypothetical protein [Hyphomicrobiales bacterium]